MAFSVDTAIQTNIKSLFWLRAAAMADGSGNATFTFGSQIGKTVYFARCQTKTAAPVLLQGTAQPQYQGGTTIPANKAQAIPLDLSNGGDPSFVMTPIDPAQSFQLYVSGLDAGVDYWCWIATDYQFGTC